MPAPLPQPCDSPEGGDPVVAAKVRRQEETIKVPPVSALTPHHLFVELDELQEEEWVERARWIKYEENLEPESGRWGRPHVASISFHSLLNLRTILEGGALLLDVTESDLPSLVHRVVKSLSTTGTLSNSSMAEILRVLAYRHKHVQPSSFRFGLRRNLSRDSLEKEDGGGRGILRSISSSPRMQRSNSFIEASAARNQDILDCLAEGTEGCLTLVGSIDIDRPVAAFIRLANSIVMSNTIEVSLPMRFIFILFTPENDFNMDAYEIGRSFSTLMSNPAFHEVCYRIQVKDELMHAINMFLDDSVVLPPGDWDKKSILPLNEIMELRERRRERKEKLFSLSKEAVNLDEDKQRGSDESKEWRHSRNPFERTRKPFGGVIEDIKQRYPHYLSDLKDGLDLQCVSAVIFIYFASLSGAIAFGGLMGTKTKDDVGIPETLLVTSMCGIVYALLSGCPLIILGVTGPLLLYDEALFTFSEGHGIEFLPWRTWIGVWTAVVAIIVAAFEGSTLVKHVTKFTKDIFASLISLLFIYEALYKLLSVFKEHPLMESLEYCRAVYRMGRLNITADGIELLPEPTEVQVTALSDMESQGDQPHANTALLSAILMFGTFFIAYFLRIFRNSKFLGRNVRRALGDFGVPIAIVIMVMLDYWAEDTYTEKLRVPNGLQVTKSTTRGWFISPMGNQAELPIWAMFGAILPGILLYIILFIETEICQLIIMERTKAEKGSGVHLDVLLLSFLNIFAGFIGGPWICAATVRAVSHVSALTVMSTNLAPGESPKITGARDQRVTACLVSILVGCSVMLSSVLKLVPFAVLFGVFLYMGVSGMSGVQFFDRLVLFFMPVKHHPQVSYVKKVKSWRMILFTILQGLGLVVLWVVKSSAAALAFPFFVLAMIPYRLLLKFIFTERELIALDGPQAGQDLSAEEVEKDFYDMAADCPVELTTKGKIQRTIRRLSLRPRETDVNLDPKMA